jgi:hypothetical protein
LTEKHVDQSEPSSNDAAVPKHTPHFFGRGAGRDVEVLGTSREIQVPNTSTDEVCFVASRQELSDHLQGVRVDVSHSHAMVVAATDFTLLFHVVEAPLAHDGFSV